jgi:hypothetical protein
MLASFIDSNTAARLLPLTIVDHYGRVHSANFGKMTKFANAQATASELSLGGGLQRRS